MPHGWIIFTGKACTHLNYAMSITKERLLKASCDSVTQPIQNYFSENQNHDITKVGITYPFPTLQEGQTRVGYSGPYPVRFYYLHG